MVDYSIVIKEIIFAYLIAILLEPHKIKTSGYSPNFWNLDKGYLSMEKAKMYSQKLTTIMMGSIRNLLRMLLAVKA